MNVLQPSFAFIQVLFFAVVITGAASRAAGQVGTGETVIQQATEQFESTPLKATSLGQGLFVFSGTGGNVTAIVDGGSTLLIDSGLASRITELLPEPAPHYPTQKNIIDVHIYSYPVLGN